jgi:hypothetical protein
VKVEDEIQEAIEKMEMEGPDIDVYLELEPGEVTDLSLDASRRGDGAQTRLVEGIGMFLIFQIYRSASMPKAFWEFNLGQLSGSHVKTKFLALIAEERRY